MAQDLTTTANLSSQLATYRIREAIRRISTGRRIGSNTPPLNTIRAESGSNYAASLNINDALAALNVTQVSVDEIAALNTRLAELGLLNTNNSLLSTSDTAALDKETASITSAIDNIVASTKYNNNATLGTSNITFTIGANPNGGSSNQLSITIGGISSIASVTAASNATSTASTLETTLGNVQGQINGATTASLARSNITSTVASIKETASNNIESANLARETAKLTKNILLKKVSQSLLAQANNLNYDKLDLLS